MVAAANWRTCRGPSLSRFGPSPSRRTLAQARRRKKETQPTLLRLRTPLEVGLEPGPHLLRELLQPRGIDEQKRDAGYLVDRGLDPRQRGICGPENVLHLARAVAERVLGHRLQLGHDRRPVQLRSG